MYSRDTHSLFFYEITVIKSENSGMKMRALEEVAVNISKMQDRFVGKNNQLLLIKY